jgi:hypothetical protein
MYYGDDDNDDGRSAVFAVKYLPRTQDDPMCRRPVITKAQELFGFRCAVGLEEGDTMRLGIFFVVGRK